MHSSKQINLQYTIGVDLGGTNVRAGLVNNGKIENHASSIIPQTDDDNEVIQCIIDVINKVFIPNVAGIGIGVPGLFDNEKGIIHSIMNIPSFKSVPIGKILNDRFKTPVFISNDVNCFALGEKFYGAGVDYRNMVGLSIGTGLGVGIISRNNLLEDANGGSGEFGEVPYLDSNIEAYASGQFFSRELNKTGKEAFQLAKEENKEALNAFKQFGIHLGKAIKVILLALDPEIIVIGGSVSQSKEFFHDTMIEEIQNFVFKETLDNLKIEYSNLEFSPILGATNIIS